MLVVVLHVLGQNPPEVRFAVDQEVVEAVAPQRSHMSLRKRIRLGDRTGVLMTRAPLPTSTWSNAAANLLSRSRMRNQETPIYDQPTRPGNRRSYW